METEEIKQKIDKIKQKYSKKGLIIGNPTSLLNEIINILYLLEDNIMNNVDEMKINQTETDIKIFNIETDINNLKEVKI